MQERINEVLTAWREADRVVRESPWATPEYRAAAADVERLRSEYMELQASARANRSTELDPE